MDLKKHWFGLKPPEDARPLRKWGSRAIYRFDRNGPHIDMMGDRISYDGPDDDADFLAWIQVTGMAAIRHLCDRRSIDPDSGETVRFDDGAYHIHASPNRSFGYLYIGAWEDE